MKKKILVTGANGQLGSVLINHLSDNYAHDDIIISDIFKPKESLFRFVELNVLDGKNIFKILNQYKITEVYHLAAVLSAKAEKYPILSWDVNFGGVLNLFQAVQQMPYPVKIFYPSSIAVFGDTTPKVDTKQNVPMIPTSNYGMAKVAGELWANYYHQKYNLDIRGLRFPGIISYQSPPGGGTTDYAIEMYVAAVKGEDYTSYIDQNTRLPMMYIDDAMRATTEIMDADSSKIKCRTSYNLAGVSFTPDELYHSIRKIYPSFKVSYAPDFRESIAKSWTESIEDKEAQKDWGWKSKFDIDTITQIMVKNLKLNLQHEQ